MWRKSSGREHGKSEKEVVVIAVSVFTLFLFFICEINDASPDFDFFFFPILNVFSSFAPLWKTIH